MSATQIAVTIDLEVEHFDKAHAAKLKQDLANFLGVEPSYIDVKPKAPTPTQTVPLKGQPTVEKVLESFSGKVERVDGEVAYLTLVDSTGQEAFADYDAAELTAQGISEGTHFTCTIKKRNHETVVTFAPVPRRRLSESEWNRLRQETKENLGNYPIHLDRMPQPIVEALLFSSP